MKLIFELPQLTNLVYSLRRYKRFQVLGGGGGIVGSFDRPLYEPLFSE